MFALDLQDIFTVQRPAVQQVLRRDTAMLIDIFVPPAAEVTIDSGVPRREWRIIQAPATP